MEKCSKRSAGIATVGVDLGDKYTQICFLDQEGEVLEEARLRTTRQALRRRFDSIPSGRVVIEVGGHSPWVSRLLKELGHEVIVANPGRLRLIYQNHRKSDRVDAESLARVGRLDPKLLAPVKHRSAEVHADRAILRSRNLLVEARTKFINHMRGVVKSTGDRLPRCSGETFAKRVNGSIPESLYPALKPVLDMIAALTEQIREYDRRIKRLAESKYPETMLLRQVPGVGPVTALTYLLTIEDPGRFKKSREVGAYLGLVPRQSDSGDINPQLRITKAGNVELRRLLVQGAQYILGPFGPQSDLRDWGLALAERGGKNAKKRAVVAVARKLAVLLHSLWRGGQVYQVSRRRAAEGKRRA